MNFLYRTINASPFGGGGTPHRRDGEGYHFKVTLSPALRELSQRESLSSKDYFSSTPNSSDRAGMFRFAPMMQRRPITAAPPSRTSGSPGT